MSTLNSLFCIAGLRPQMPGPAGVGGGTGVAIAEAFGLGVPEGVLVKAGVVLVGVAAGCFVAWDEVLIGVGVSVARLFRSCCSQSVFWVSASSFWSQLGEGCPVGLVLEQECGYCSNRDDYGSQHGGCHQDSSPRWSGVV